MKPTLRPGQIVLVYQTRNFKVGDVVVAFMGRREVVKRVSKYEEGRVFLEGDNKKASTDSRQHGWLVDSNVEGKVVWPKVSRRNSTKTKKL